MKHIFLAGNAIEMILWYETQESLPIGVAPPPPSQDKLVVQRHRPVTGTYDPLPLSLPSPDPNTPSSD